MQLRDLLGPNAGLDFDSVRISWLDLEEYSNLNGQETIPIAVAILSLLQQTIESKSIELGEAFPLEADLQVFAPVVRNEQQRTQFTFTFTVYAPYVQPVLDPDEVS